MVRPVVASSLSDQTSANPWPISGAAQPQAQTLTPYRLYKAPNPSISLSGELPQKPDRLPLLRKPNRSLAGSKNLIPRTQNRSIFTSPRAPPSSSLEPTKPSQEPKIFIPFFPEKSRQKPRAFVLLVSVLHVHPFAKRQPFASPCLHQIQTPPPLPLTGATLSGHRGARRDRHCRSLHGHHGKEGGLSGSFQDVAIVGQRHQGSTEGSRRGSPLLLFSRRPAQRTSSAVARGRASCTSLVIPFCSFYFAIFLSEIAR